MFNECYIRVIEHSSVNVCVILNNILRQKLDMINERQIIYILKSNRKEGNQNTTIKSDPWNTRLQKELAKYQIKEEEMVKCRAKSVT